MKLLERTPTLQQERVGKTLYLKENTFDDKTNDKWTSETLKTKMIGFLENFFHLIFSRDSDLRNSSVSPSVCLFVCYQVV